MQRLTTPETLQSLEQLKSTSKYFNQIEGALKEITETITPDLSEYLKKFVEENITQIAERKPKVKLDLVVDANAVISDMLRIARGKQSTILQSTQEPFLALYAPPYLQDEMKRKIPSVAKDKGLDESTLEKIWNERFVPVINFSLKPRPEAVLKAISIVGGRDSKDTPYVELSLSFDSEGIITYDKDISDQIELKTWTMHGVRDTVTMMKQGSLILFASAYSVGPLAELVVSFVSSIFEAVIKAISTAIQFLSSILSGATEQVKRAPKWVFALLGVAAAGLILALVFSEKFRNDVVELIDMVVDAAKELVKTVIDNTWSLTKKCAELLSPELFEIGFGAFLVIGGNLIELFDFLGVDIENSSDLFKHRGER